MRAVPEQTTPASSSFLDRVREVPLPLRYIILAAGIAIFLLSAWLSVQRNLDFAWTSVRLAPAYALTHGYPLFSSPETPPWVMVGYGPLYPVAYLPSTVARTPSTAVALGTVLAHFYILFPAALLVRLAVERVRLNGVAPRLPWPFFLLLFTLVAYAAPSLNYVTSNVHVDAPALGLFLFAAYAILRADVDASRARWILVAGLCAGLSAACKVNLLAASLGFTIWLFLRLGLKPAITFVAWAAGAFLAIYALAVLRDGFAAVLLNLQLPGRMPWFTYQNVDTRTLSGSSYGTADKLRTFVGFVGEYLRDYGIFGVAILLLLPIVGRTSARAAEMTKFFLLLALVMLFASIASVGKSGGDVNSRALFTLPLAIAGLVAFTMILQQSGRAMIAAAYGALAAVTFVVALSAAAGLLRWSIKGTSTLVEAHETVSREPGRWYFPFDPLAHLLGEGKFRPNMDVVHSYAAAGSPVDRAAFLSTLPAELEHIAVPPSFASWGIAEIRRLLPEYGRVARELDLEHHNVITR